MTPSLMNSETILNQLLKLPRRPRNAPWRNRKSRIQAAKRILRQDGRIAPHQMKSLGLVVNLITHKRGKRTHLITHQMRRSLKIQDKMKMSLKIQNMRKLHQLNQMMASFLKNLSLASQLLPAPLLAMMISLARDTFPLQESLRSVVYVRQQALLA